MGWLTNNWMLVAGLVLSGIGIWLLMPRAGGRATAPGAVLSVVGLALLTATLRPVLWGSDSTLTETVLFSIFSIVAIASAIRMITNRNPVYAALWFALVTLSTCGLFLLQSAPFLAAATIVVYAGAIVVTFVFVMMLAQQRGATIYDQRSHQPLLATIVAFILLGALLSTIEMRSVGANAGDAAANSQAEAAAATTNLLSQPVADEPLGTLHGLGRSLFGDYLFAVELAGTLLLIAAIGAIAMAPRRAEGRL